MDRTYDVMAAGHLCLDVIPRFPRGGGSTIGEILRPGKLVNVEEAGISTGGPVSNTGLNMQTLGAEVCFCARVGDDDFGRLTIDRLERSGNASGVHVARDKSSSYTIVVAPPGIDRIFLHNPGTNNEFGPEDLDPGLIAQCRHFHFGYPPLMKRMYEDGGRALAEVFRIAKESGATTSCDMSLPDPNSESGRADWRAILERVLPHVDLHLPSIEESVFMLEPERFLEMKTRHGGADLIDHLAPEDYSRTAQTLLDLGAGIVSLKTGHRGFYVRTGTEERLGELGAARPGDSANWADRELWAPAFIVEELASATGSGDSAIAGFLSGFLRGLGIEASLKYATCCGWQNLQVLDAVSGIHSWAETTAFLEQDMPMIDAHVDRPGWQWSDVSGLWTGPGDRRSS